MFRKYKAYSVQKIYDMTMKKDIQPKKKPGKIIISIDGDTFQQLEIYCWINGIFCNDFVSFALEYFECTEFNMKSKR